ncbi:MAG: hypothetical protein ACOZCO_05700 [Bacteroidota bacterium]
MKKTIKIFFMFLFFCACNDQNSFYCDKINGTYAVDELIYEQQSYKNQMSANILDFSKDKKCKFPRFMLVSERGYGTWEIEIKNDSPVLQIKTDYLFFSGEYNMYFNNDYSKLELVSDSVEIYLSKIME